MKTDVNKMKIIFDTIARTGKSLRVAFNYRYAPAHTKLRELMMQGVIGRPLCVNFSWALDTRHGADYFRRWHREKQNSGGLLVHKATHHFDLVNWWIDSYADSVFAMGDLLFYGQSNAESRGEKYPYNRYTGVPKAKDDPFALFLDQNEVFKGLYLNAEDESGYLRDRNVFGTPITIEDTMSASVRYRNGVILSYCLVAYSPWEGLRVAITGTKGQIEMEIVEYTNYLLSDREAKIASASQDSFKSVSLRVHPMFGTSYHVEVPTTSGGHGGADPVMLEQLFSPTPPTDPFNRTASHIDGAASILVGISANESLRTGNLIHLDNLFKLENQ